MSCGRVAVAAAIAFICSACDEAPQVRPPTPRSDAAASSDQGGTVPARTYYLTNDEQQCFVQWKEGDERSPKLEAMCPREVAPGERIRLTGKSCIRESTVPTRNVPVRCPYRLVEAEQDDHDSHAADP